MEDISYCKEHNKEFEFVCNLCPNDNKTQPMCSICMWKHNEQCHNFKGNTHLFYTVSQSLAKIHEATKNSNDRMALLENYAKKAIDAIELKEKVANGVKSRLEKLKASCTRQSAVVAEKDMKINQVCEELLGKIEAAKCRIAEDRSDPEQKGKVVESMLKAHRYCEANKCAEETLRKIVEFDVRDIERRCEECEVLIEGFSKQDGEGEIIRGTEIYKKLAEENARKIGMKMGGNINV